MYKKTTAFKKEEKSEESLPICISVPHPEMVRNSVEELPCDDGTGLNNN